MAAELDVDPDALRARYRVERDKRLRPDGLAQFVELTGRFAHYTADPYVTAPIERDPLSDTVEAVVVGGGFGGLLCAGRLRERGVDSVRVIEQGGDYGGTWYWNRYPGAACDVEAYIYLPLLEHVGAMPTERYAGADEIRAHARALATHFDLYRDVCFQTKVTGLTWDESTSHWTVATDRGDAIRARFVVMANGPLNRPKLPGIPGLTDFEGHTFHTSRWDYAYTGGGPSGGLDRLGDKRVGIIGTGATAVQCIPHLAEGAQHLYVFQRTPSSIDVRGNAPTDPAWVAGLEAGWHQARMENFNDLTGGIPLPVDLVHDAWTDVIREVMTRAAEAGTDGPSYIELMQLADYRKMDQVRRRVDAIVTDPAAAEVLKPWYDQWCKRPCFSDTYLPVFNRPNVTLVDTDGRGVERITARGVVVAGREHEVDCIVYATGFEVSTGYVRQAQYDVVGRGGQTLSGKWATGTRTMHGILTHGFPNLLIVSLTQAGFSINIPHILDEQSKHIAHIVGAARGRGAGTVEVSTEGEDAWVQEHLSVAKARARFLMECTPGYYNQEGMPNNNGGLDGVYGAGPTAYIRRLHEWQAEGTPGLLFDGAPS